MEVSPKRLQHDSLRLVDDGGSFCERVEPSASQFCQLVSPTESVEGRRIFSELERPPGLCVPSLLFNTPLPIEDSAGPSVTCADQPLLAEPIVVPVHDGTVDGNPPPLSPQSRPIDLPDGGSPPINSERYDSANRLETLGSCLRAQGLPSDVVELLLAASRDNTHATYQSAWTAWRNWCHRGDINPLSTDVTDVLKFLAESFKQGKSYSSLNILRSMISTTQKFGPASHTDVGKHPLIVRLMRGIYNARPAAPKYTHTWDPAVVLGHFDATATRILTRLQLARKTATLLALTTLLRSAELTSIQAQSIVFSESGVSFSLGRLRKAQKSGPLQRITAAAWPDNSIICPVSFLRAYITSTSSVRNETNANQLFIGSNKPFKPITSSTMSRWLKDQLKEAGVDISIFSAHSIRGAAASKAAAAGVCIQSILDQGHWARESTFARFYRRDTFVDSPGGIGPSILRQEQNALSDSD